VHVKKLILFSVILVLFRPLFAKNIIILPQGRFKTIPFKPSQRFILSNKNHLKIKVTPSQNGLIIKALQKGISELIILENNSSSPVQTYTIQSPGIYEDKRLNKSVLNNIYFHLFQSGLNNFECFLIGQTPHCYIDDHFDIPKKLTAFLQKKYKLKIYKTPPITTSYLLSFELLLIEKNGAQQIQTGINEINLSINSKSSQIRDEFILSIKQEEIKVRSLLKQQLNVTIGRPFRFSVGGEIHYETTNTYIDKKTKTNHWKFMGLNSEMKLEQINGQLFITYNNSFSRPMENLNYHHEKQQGKSFIDIDKKVALFELSYQQEESLMASIPYLNQIPVLRYLFSSISSTTSQKKIIALIKLQRTSL
jgi:hypothetical protein